MPQPKTWLSRWTHLVFVPSVQKTAFWICNCGSYLPNILLWFGITLCRTMKKSQVLPVRLDFLYIFVVTSFIIKPSYPATHGRWSMRCKCRFWKVDWFWKPELISRFPFTDGATDLIAATRCRARWVLGLEVLIPLQSHGLKKIKLTRHDAWFWLLPAWFAN